MPCPVQATYFDGLWDGIYLGLIEDENRYLCSFSGNCTDTETLRGLNEGWEQVQGVKDSKGTEKEIKWNNLVYTIDNIYLLVSEENVKMYDGLIDLSYGVRE